MCEHCNGERPIIDAGPFFARIRESRIAVDYIKGRSHQRVVRNINYCPMCGAKVKEWS